VSQFKLYTGNGQSGVWNDPNNWTNGLVPGPADTALITKSAVLNGSIEVDQVMFLGTETITINAALKTDDTNTCKGVMVCDHAVATFEPGSTLSDAGGFITGNDSVGTTYVDGAANGKAAAVLNTTVLKVGQTSEGTGVLNVAGIINNSGGSYVGFGGNGTMNVTGNGQVNLAKGLVVGNFATSVGTVNLSGNGEVTAANVQIGNSTSGAPGGVGTVTVGVGAHLNSASTIAVNYGSALVMAGGTASVVNINGVQINAGGSVSGYGHISAGNGAVVDNGALASSGGTLLLSGNVNGMGSVHIGAGSTLDISANKINVPHITFMGSNATLELTTGVNGSFSLDGFAATDQILMAGIDAVSWNGSTDMLSLSEQGHVMDTLHFDSVPTGMAFHLTQENSAPSIITLIPSH
jgi:hypothetical protein